LRPLIGSSALSLSAADPDERTRLNAADIRMLRRQPLATLARTARALQELVQPGRSNSGGATMACSTS